jgi:hypothetical protein
VYVSNKPPQDGESSPAEEEAHCAEGQGVSPPHVHDGGHSILEEAPFVLGHVTWVQVAGAIFEHRPVMVVVVMVVVGACSWWGVIRYGHTGVLHHL